MTPFTYEIMEFVKGDDSRTTSYEVWQRQRQQTVFGWWRRPKYQYERLAEFDSRNAAVQFARERGGGFYRRIDVCDKYGNPIAIGWMR